MKKNLLKGNYVPKVNPEMEAKNSTDTTNEFEKKTICFQLNCAPISVGCRISCVDSALNSI